MATGLVAYDSEPSDVDSDADSDTATSASRLRLQSAPDVEKPDEQLANEEDRIQVRVEYDGEEEDESNEDEDAAGEDPDAAGDAVDVPSPAASDDSDQEDWPFKVKSRQAARLMPSPPRGHCSNSLQRKMEHLLARKQKEGLNLNRSVQDRKDFRNPSIYDKLVSFLDLDENGSNFTSFNPAGWGPESYYEKLAHVQKDQYDRKKKQEETGHKTQVEFVTATKRPATSTTSSESDAKKRRSKWDAGPPQ